MRKDYEKLNNINFEELSDEEIDEFYRPRQCNSAKSLLPLYVFLILQNTPEDKHLTQKEIAKLLEDRYELKVERKALSRALHALDDANIGVISTSDSGTWYDAA